MASNRIEAIVTMKNIFEYERPAYGYGTETAYIYTMTGEDGTVYVWKTTAYMGLETEDTNGNYTNARGKKVKFHRVNKGDKIVITASVKGQGEYKGQPQTILTRVKVKESDFAGESRKEAKMKKAKEQRESLKGEDFIWTMPYKQYKEHYSDCETIIDSYDTHEEENSRRIRGFIPPTIEVIIREGRLKKSGVRGERYSGYMLQNENGETVTYRAVKEENAIRRANKEHPGHEWECIKVYEYDSYRWW